MKRWKRRTKTLLPLAIIVALVASFYFIINSHTIQIAVLKSIKPGDYKFEIENLKFNIFRNQIVIQGLEAKNAKARHRIYADIIEIKYSPLSLLGGKLVLPKFVAKGAVIDFPPPQKTSEEKKKISIKKLLLLQNLVIEEGIIERADLKFKKDQQIFVDTITFEFKPRLSGDVALKLNLQGASSGDESLWVGSFILSGKTKVAQWADVSPYVNALEGEFHFQDIKFGGVPISSFAAHASVRDEKIQISELEIIKDGRPLKGNSEINLAKNTYTADIKIPEPIVFPTLGSENPVIDTSGTIEGSVSIEGKGFNFKSAIGSAKIALTHSKENLPPLVISSAISWKNGVASIKDSTVKINEGLINVNGTVNIPSKKFDIKFDARDVPLEAAFGRFNDKNFHPIFGHAKASAELVGWAHDFRVTGVGETTGPSGYYKIVTERAIAKVDATYNEFNLTGDISQRGQNTGHVILKIKYGRKTPGQTRHKNIHLEAGVTNHDLKDSFVEYNLTGLGNGTLALDGPPQSYAGRISAGIKSGSFAGVSFQGVSTNAGMTYKKIKFTDGEVELANADPVIFSSPIQMDFSEGGFKMYGHPIDGVSFDTSYTGSNNTWKLSNILYHDLKIHGVYAPTGSSDVKFEGGLDAASLQVFKEHLREAAGPLDVDLRLAGSITNPGLYGKIEFNGNTIYPRIINQRMENVIGELLFNDHTIKSNYLSGLTENGTFNAKGVIQHQNLLTQTFNLAIQGQNLRYTTDNRAFRMEYNADVTWSGNRASSMLKGDITILDGKYSKDFTIIEGLSSKREEPPEGLLGSDDLHINLNIQNTGDLAIRNNIGDIWLRTNIMATGTALHPMISGSVETTEGKIRYLGRDFVITHGSVEFRAPYTNPQLEITAEHEVPNIPDHIIIITLRGRTDNLALELSSTPPLEKRDIISLLLFGVTEQEIRETQWSAQLGPSVVASQITSLIERPVSKLARLDIFRLEAASGTDSTSSQGTQLSRMYLGKKLTDRLSLEFITDINTEDALQTLRAEYLLTDFLLLKAERSTEKYKLNISLRFKER